jgi:WD40 repeat protein
LEWEKILSAEKSTPAPLFAASPMTLESPLKPSEQRDYINFVYDVEFDQAGNRLLFCGIEGNIRFFNLNEGSTGVLLKPPGTNYIRRLLLSPDREHICCICTPSTEDRNKKPNRIQVWNYRILRTAVGLD